MQMAGTTGREILEQIRITGSDIPVWLMTAYDDYTQEKALAEGFTGFITKPVSMSNLLQILDLDGHSQSKKNETVSKQSNNKADAHLLSKRFPWLSAMFDHDEDAVRDILTDFVDTSGEDTKQLKNFIQEGKYTQAQQLCHRIYPFYMQLEAEHLCKPLRKMDMLRGQDEGAYPNWREELSRALESIEQFRLDLHDKHL